MSVGFSVEVHSNKQPNISIANKYGNDEYCQNQEGMISSVGIYIIQMYYSVGYCSFILNLIILISMCQCTVSSGWVDDTWKLKDSNRVLNITKLCNVQAGFSYKVAHYLNFRLYFHL
jgi:hypothetical protein